MYKAFPLDMSQYGRLFNSTRIPRFVAATKVFSVGQTFDVTHCLVFSMVLLSCEAMLCCRVVERLSKIVNDTASHRVFVTLKLLVYCNFFVTVTCPCSSTTKCHVNLFVYNNNNNKIK